MPKYKKLRNGPIELRTKTLDKHVMKALKYQNEDTFIPRNDKRIFKHLEWEIQPFQLYSGKIPSLIEWLLNLGNKEKI